MGRIGERFAALQRAGRRGLIPFLTAGDPAPALTVPLMHALVRAGADLIELGVPFSDPMADGPVIQAGNQRALQNGVNLPSVLDMVRVFRRADTATPVVLMGYLNPVEAHGYERFAQDAANAGVDGVITVDMPPEEGEGLERALRAHGLDPIFLLSPTSTSARIARVLSVARGFVYYVSLRGVTGAANMDVVEVERKVNVIRNQSKLPVGVGFGIHDASSAARVARFADAVVVGSALVARIAECAARPPEIEAQAAAFIAGLRRAIDAATAPASGARA